jgi:hypothetical protein
MDHVPAHVIESGVNADAIRPEWIDVVLDLVYPLRHYQLHDRLPVYVENALSTEDDCLELLMVAWIREHGDSLPTTDLYPD